MITEKINLLKIIDDNLAKDLIIKAKEISTEAKIEMITLLVIAIAIMILSLFLARIISTNIIYGIRALQSGVDNFFKFLNKESDDAQLIDLQRKDAVGIMANKVNDNINKTKEIIIDDIKFAQEIKDVVSMIKNGYLYQRLEYNPISKNLQELKREINEMLEVMNQTVAGSVNKITDVLNSYAALDFTNNITNAKGHVETSILNVGDMITNMLVEKKRMD